MPALATCGDRGWAQDVRELSPLLQGRASGTPNAGPVARIEGRKREVIERGCVTETETTTRPEGEGAGTVSDSEAAAMSRPLGRKP